MDKYAQLADALKRLNSAQTILTTAQVVSIEGNTCTVTIDGLEIDGVFLCPTTSGKILITPKKDSYVLLGSLSGDFRQLTVLSVDEADTITISNGNKESISIDAANGTLTFNGGTLGGLVKIADLVSQLNTIEKAFNELLNSYKTHNHLHPQGSTTGFVVPPTQSNISETQRADIENENVKQ